MDRKNDQTLQVNSVDSPVPSILPPGFESQAHHLCFYQFIFELCHVEKTKINKKRSGLAHSKKHITSEFKLLIVGKRLFDQKS